MKEINKILLKLQSKARKEAIKELLKEHRDDPEINRKLKKLQEKELVI